MAANWRSDARFIDDDGTGKTGSCSMRICLATAGTSGSEIRFPLVATEDEPMPAVVLTDARAIGLFFMR